MELTCPLKRLMSFLELVFDPTTSGRLKLFNIASAIFVPFDMLGELWRAVGSNWTSECCASG